MLWFERERCVATAHHSLMVYERKVNRILTALQELLTYRILLSVGSAAAREREPTVRILWNHLSIRSSLTIDSLSIRSSLTIDSLSIRR